MRLTGVEQHAIENALDEALVAPGDQRTVVKIERALRIMRERPEGVSRIRSDAGDLRRVHNRDVWSDAWDPT
ncbi:hypothetical protein [Algiphilus aromaticivorans]|uniref:hypothetical protein n=1 Tax=Algiphilus aromaticivorans TaxID=382454 RepID=UPI0005C1AFFD|nr:hypothetical protein [Algiphilus aromaticivorans]